MAYTEEQTDKIFKAICERISKGEALRNIINKPDTFSSTVFYELIEDKKKNEQYTRAREERAEVIFEDILEIADYSGKDQVDIGDGVMAVNHEAMQRDRLRVDARKWMLSKMNPKKYGDKVALEHESPDGSMSPNKKIDLSKLSDKELLAYKELQKKIEDE